MHQLWDFFSELLPYMPFLLIYALAYWVGIIIIVRSHAALSDSIQRQHWPRIQSKIIRYEVNRYTTGGQASETRFAYATISSYEVQDHFHLHECASHGGFKTWECAESEALQRCPIGQWVELIYNPEDPQQSRLPNDMGWKWSSFRGIWLGVAIASIGAGFLLGAILYIRNMPLEIIFYTAKFSLIILGMCIVIIFSCSPLAAIFMAIRKGLRKMMMSQK
jgi:hypothetical protein